MENINEGIFSAIKISSQFTKAQGAIVNYFKENKDKYKDINAIKADLKKVASEAYKKNVTEEGAKTFDQWYPEFEKSFFNMFEHINEGTHIYLDGRIEQDLTIDPNDPIYDSVPPQLIQLIHAYRTTSEFTDDMIRSVLVGMCIDQQMVLNGIKAYNQKFGANKNKPQTDNTQKNNISKMNKINLTNVYERLTNCISTLDTIAKDANEKGAYSAYSAKGICENILMSFPVSEMTKNIARKNSGLEINESNINALTKYTISRTIFEALTSYDWLAPVKELRAFVKESYDTEKWQYTVANILESMSGRTDGFSKKAYDVLYAVLEKNSDTFYADLKEAALNNTWSRECNAILESMEMFEASVNGDKTPAASVANNECVAVNKFSPVINYNANGKEGFIFNLNERNYFISKDSMEIELADNVFDQKYMNVLEGLNIMSFDGQNSFNYFGKNNTTISYDYVSESIKVGNVDLAGKSIIDIKSVLVASGAFDRSNAQDCDTILKMYESRDILTRLNNFYTFESATFSKMSVSIMETAKGVYVNMINPSMDINEMAFFETAHAAVDAIKSFIGYDATKLLENKLIAEGDADAKVQKERAEINERIDRLEEERTKLKEAIKNYGENDRLVAALNGIDKLIAEQNDNMQKTYASNTTLNESEMIANGYVKCKVVRAAQVLDINENVYVKEDEFRSLMNNEPINVLKEDNTKVVVAKSVIALA